MHYAAGGFMIIIIDHFRLEICPGTLVIIINISSSSNITITIERRLYKKNA